MSVLYDCDEREMKAECCWQMNDCPDLGESLLAQVEVSLCGDTGTIACPALGVWIDNHFVI